MRKSLLVSVFISAVIAACTQAAMGTTLPAPTGTADPTSTATLAPTSTLTATITPTPLVSAEGGMTAVLTIANGSARNVHVYWIDFEGAERFYKRLKPSQSYDQLTYLNHAWRVRDEASGEVLQELLVRGREQKVILFPLEGLDLGPTLVPTKTPVPAVVEGYAGCVISAPPAEMNFHPFFGKYCDADGIPIISSEEVQDLALKQAWYIVVNMLAPRPDLHEEMANRGVQFAIFGAKDDISDIPFFRDIDPRAAFAVTGGSVNYPVATNSEGNLLCWAGYHNFEGLFVAVHEFAHAIHNHGLVYLDPDFDSQLEGLYDEAMEAGLWENTYSSLNHYEYWAEGVTFFFNASPKSQPYRNYVNTREELRSYDPALFTLISEVFRGFEWTPSCP